MKKHILLIDGNKHELDYFLDALREVPEDDGFKCTYASNVMQAVDMLKLLVPHYIFIDKALPVRETIYVLQMIKEDMRMRHVKVFLYTSNDEHPEKAAIIFGVNGYVERSRSTDKLGRQLATALQE